MAKYALTYGEPKGIGLEIIQFLLSSESLVSVLENHELIIFGDKNLIGDISHQNISIEHIPFNREDHSFLCTDFAIESCLNGLCQGLITGPIDKSEWIKSGHKWRGQTELLRFKCECEPEMLFIAKDWRILLLTRHIALKDVPSTLTHNRFNQAIQTLENFLLNYYQIQKPKIAIAGLNPHAGENGEIGEEEILWQGWGLSNILSPDKIWLESAKNYLQNNQQSYDAYLAPYHDQVLPLIKTITNFQAVNISIGLPFIRTSPDHGVAYDLFGTGLANYRPFLEAIRLAISLQQNKTL